MGKLIFNADDFGLTAGVNRAIAELHALGVIGSTTLMARAQATTDAIEIARQTPTLAVGCHVVLVNGDPVLSPTLEIPHLVEGRTGRFRASLSHFLPWMMGLVPGGGSAAERAQEIEAETVAQISLLQAQGLQLTHIDTHKHVHMFPSVLAPVLRAALHCGIRTIRNPFEPVWSVAASRSASLIRRMEVRLLRRMEAQFLQMVGQAGFRTTQGALGVAVTGSLQTHSLHPLLEQMPADGIFELVTHPGYCDEQLQQAATRLLRSREHERQALAQLSGHPLATLATFSTLE